MHLNGLIVRRDLDRTVINYLKKIRLDEELLLALFRHSFDITLLSLASFMSKPKFFKSFVIVLFLWFLKILWFLLLKTTPFCFVISIRHWIRYPNSFSSVCTTRFNFFYDAKMLKNGTYGTSSSVRSSGT